MDIRFKNVLVLTTIIEVISTIYWIYILIEYKTNIVDNQRLPFIACVVTSILALISMFLILKSKREIWFLRLLWVINAILCLLWLTCLFIFEKGEFIKIYDNSFNWNSNYLFNLENEWTPMTHINISLGVVLIVLACGTIMCLDQLERHILDY